MHNIYSNLLLLSLTLVTGFVHASDRNSHGTGRGVSSVTSTSVIIPIENPFDRVVAKKWFVGDNTAQYTIDYADINSAMSSNNVMEGDTLFICMTKGKQMTGAQKVSKKVFITGQGYDISVNNDKLPLGSVYMEAEGAHIDNVGMYALYVNENNITITHTYVHEIYGNKTSNENDSCLIHACFIRGTVFGNGDNGTDAWTISNNIIECGVKNLENATIDHNTFYSDKLSPLTNVTESNITNNLLWDKFTSTAGCSDNTYTRNIFNYEAEDVDFSNNKICSNLADVIAATSDNTEAFYAPVGESLGYSTDGTNCGAYGGSDPYVKGGTYNADDFDHSEDIDPNDRLALRNIYERYNGENWTSVKWNINGTKKTDFPNVTFATINDTIRVQEIDLSEQNLQGSVTGWTVYLPYLTYFNLRGNKLTGDITQFLGQLRSLKTLDISRNRLCGLTSLPESVKTLFKDCQNADVTDFNGLYDSQPLYICSDKTWSRFADAYVNFITKFSIGAFNLDSMKCVPPTLWCKSQPENNYVNKLIPHYGNGGYYYSTQWNLSPYIYKNEQNHDVIVKTDDDSTFPAYLIYINGDANMDGMVAVNDVQTDINYILTPNAVTLYNASAANTYSDELINVQDIVTTVNILLDQYNSNSAQSKGDKADTIEDDYAVGTIYTQDNSLCLNVNEPVAALEIALHGVTTDEVGMNLNRKDFQMAGRNTPTGSHFVIYSLSGKTIPTGNNSILHISNGVAVVESAEASSLDARMISLDITNATTGINEVATSNSIASIRFAGSNLTITSIEDVDNASLSITSLSGSTLLASSTDIKAGTNIIATQLPAGVYVVTLSSGNRRISNVKLIKQ